jgi:hypothetical protein
MRPEGKDVTSREFPSQFANLYHRYDYDDYRQPN